MPFFSPVGGGGLTPISATGGTITYSADEKYKIHTFTSSGNFVVSSNTGNDTVEVLVVGGGGGGGGGVNNSGGGGGGGGGILHASFIPTATTYPVVVGAGGAYAIQNGNGNNGSDSSINSYTATGGKGGGGGSGSYNLAGAAGLPTQPGTFPPYLGNGNTNITNAGISGIASYVSASGSVLVSSISGTSATYGGGGGGGKSGNNGTVAGSGAGNGGAGTNTNGATGANGFGYGGGGGGGYSSGGWTDNSSGYQGVVIVRYKVK